MENQNPQQKNTTLYEIKVWINENGELETTGKVGKDLTPQLLNFFKNMFYILENKAKSEANRTNQNARHFEKRNDEKRNERRN